MSELSLIKERNANIIDELTSTDSGLQKQAAGDITDFLRIRAREDGFTRTIMNRTDVGPADLDRMPDTVKPVIIKDMEPGSNGAYSIPMGNAPSNAELNVPRYRIIFDRIVTERYHADKNNLLSYELDVKQIFNDLMLKDLLDEEDRKFIGVNNTLCTNGIVASDDILDARVTDRDNTFAYYRNTVESKGYADVGPMSRETIADALKAIPSTNRNLRCKTMMINSVTVNDVMAFGRDEVGGDFSEDMFLNGFTKTSFMGCDLIVTIKKDLVPTDFMYMYAAPKYLGDFCVLDDVTVSNESKNFMLDMFAYECVGSAIKNEGALGIASFGVSTEAGGKLVTSNVWA